MDILVNWTLAQIQNKVDESASTTASKNKFMEELLNALKGHDKGAFLKPLLKLVEHDKDTLLKIKKSAKKFFERNKIAKNSDASPASECSESFDSEHQDSVSDPKNLITFIEELCGAIEMYSGGRVVVSLYKRR